MTLFPPCEVICEIKLDDKNTVVLDSHGGAHFWQENYEGLTDKLFIIESALPYSKSMYDFELYTAKLAKKDKRILAIYRGEDPRKLQSLFEEDGIPVTEEVWEALDANRLARKMTYGK